MKLTVIGCTGSMSGPASPASCYLLQAQGYDPEIGTERTWNIVLDLGPGSFGALWGHIDPVTIDAVLFSHCHADHMGDVISLHVFKRWGPGQGTLPVRMGGSCDLLPRIRGIDGVGEEESYEDCFTFHTFTDEPHLQIGPFSVETTPVWHSIDSFAMRIEAERPDGTRASLVYTGDTDYCEQLVRCARGVDVLLSECGFTTDDAVEGIHMDGVDVGRLATTAQVGRLLVTHIQPWTDYSRVRDEISQTWNGDVHIVASNDVINV